MFKVKVKGEGVKLANKWCYINDEAIIDEQEYEKNKEYVDVIEIIKESKEGQGENPEGENSGEGKSDNEKDEELEALKERAKELGINVTHNMKKETIINKIEEIEKSKEGQGENPEGE